ncbi:MAG TPA: hypothetical protein VE135_03745 [Pyrinomonadaceae bacterium]|nr:hypothetical protein [Pyrinomonadaceae bacterium]
MIRDDAPTNQRLAKLIEQLVTLTKTGELHWERQRGSAHRYARWKNNLLILGPAEPLETHVPRYLFITPFDSPSCVEVNSSDDQLGEAVMLLVKTVEESSKQEPPTDPFAITDEILARLT